MSYLLHYAPDNASLIPRLALEHRGLPYETRLVRRDQRAQEAPAYRRLNPLGQIPVLETAEGPIFETAAILLYLADRHGGLGPGPAEAGRGDLLKWLFFLSNSVHAAERMLFYPEKYIAAEALAALRAGMAAHLGRQFALLEAEARQSPLLRGEAPTLLGFYAAALLRWPALYPRDADRGWFRLSDLPALRDLCLAIEALPATAALQSAEGLGRTPFSNPQPPQPPEGSAL